MAELQSIFAEFAAACVGNVKGNGDIAYPHKLKRKSLDYSPSSLKEIDAYLEFLFQKKNLSDQENTQIPFCGAGHAWVKLSGAMRRENTSGWTMMIT